MRSVLEIRPAADSELDEVGRLTVEVYVRDGHVDASSPYVEELRDARRRATEAEVLVAVEDGRVVGSVTFAPAENPWAEVATGDEAEFRMLVVAPEARGRGVGASLVAACVERARSLGRSGLALSTQDDMGVAHRLYERLGFVREPARDWSPFPGLCLRVFTLALPDPQRWCGQCGEAIAGGDHGACERRATLEPPRYCPTCRRRMVVQVTPRYWSARCVEHGTRTG